MNRTCTPINSDRFSQCNREPILQVHTQEFNASNVITGKMQALQLYTYASHMVPSKSTDDDVQCSCIVYRDTQWRKNKTKIVFFFISGAFSHLCATRSILPRIVVQYALYNVKDVDMHSLNYSECIYINDVVDAFIDGVLLVGAWIGFQMRSDFIERLIS